MCHCQKGWMNVFLLACMWLLSECHSRSFQVGKLSGRCGSSSLEATLLTCKINVTEVFAYVTASDTVWSLHERDICHLTGLRPGKIAEASLSFVAQMFAHCVPGVFSLQSLGHPGVLPVSCDFCELSFLLLMSLKNRLDHLPNFGNEEKKISLALFFIVIFPLCLFLSLDSCSPSCCNYLPLCNCLSPSLTPPALSCSPPKLKAYIFQHQKWWIIWKKTIQWSSEFSAS